MNKDKAGEMTLDAEANAKHFPSRGYSPYADRGGPTQPMWGDTHLHTSNSPDAFASGKRLDPEDAYHIARDDTVTASNGRYSQTPALSSTVSIEELINHPILL